MRTAFCFLAIAGYAVAQTAQAPLFQDFPARVQDYLKLRENVQSALPRQKPTKKRKEIVEREAALAQGIRTARANAKQGDIFTPAITQQIHQVILSAFQGPNARYVRKTIREGAPVKGWTASVNGKYPDHLPLTTVPPTLLMTLPQLPKELAYHIIGRDLVLQDTEARIVIDYIPNALSFQDVPSQPSSE